MELPSKSEKSPEKVQNPPTDLADYFKALKI